MTTTDRRDATDAQFADELARLEGAPACDEDTVERLAILIHGDSSYEGTFRRARLLAQHVLDALKPAPGTDTSGQAVQRVLDLADELDSHVKPRSFHPAGTHSDGASSAYADAAARIRAAVAGPQRDEPCTEHGWHVDGHGPQRDHDEEGGQ